MQKKSVIANLSSAESNTVVLCDKAKNLIWNAANKLKGSLRRQFMAKTVQEPGPGSQSFAEQQLEWNRGTIRKGMHELSSGISCIDSFSLKGRKKSEERMLNLEDDIRDIADSKSQVDATFSQVVCI